MGIFAINGAIPTKNATNALPDRSREDVGEPIQQLPLAFSQFTLDAYVTHNPIAIVGNADFHTQAANEGWDLGGTRDGTAEKPYVIENIEISNPSITNLIYIASTDVYFTIANSSFIGTGGANQGRVGIHFEGVAHGIIYNNTIKGSDTGVLIRSGSTDNLVSTNVITQNSLYGVYINASDNNKVWINYIDSNSKSGLYIYGSTKNTVELNDLYSNGEFGLLLEVSDYNEIKRNVADSNTQSGYYLVSSDYNLLTKNNASSNMASGFQATDSDYNTISHGLFKQNLQYGIYLEPGTNYNTLEFNEITYNANDGMHLSTATYNRIYDNQIITNGNHGIYLFTGGMSIYRNVIANNAADGINGRLTSCTIKGNEIFGNVGNGIYYDSSTTQLKILGNYIHNNLAYGVYGYSSLINSVTWNHFESNSNSPQVYFNGQTIDHNYYSDHTTPDVNSDNIVDTNYTVAGTQNFNDTTPLTSKFTLTTPAFLSPISGTYDQSLYFAVNNVTNTFNGAGIGTYYTFTYSADGGTTWSDSSWNGNHVYQVSSINNTNWDISAFNNGSYIIRLSAEFNGQFKTVYSIPFTVEHYTPDAPESIATQLVLASTYDQTPVKILVTWNVPTNTGSTGITAYTLYKGISPSTMTKFKTINYFTTQYYDIDVTLGETYYYSISANNSYGIGRNSTVVSEYFASSPGFVTNLAASEISGGFSVTWDVPPDNGESITGYKLFRGCGVAVYDTVFNTVTNSYEDTNLTPLCTTFSYTVMAINSLGHSYFNASYIYVPYNTVPSEPKNVQASLSNSEVSLSWEAPDWSGGLAIYYRIYRGTASGVYDTFFDTTDLIYLDSSIDVTLAYYYVVAAYNGKGFSSNTTETKVQDITAPTFTVDTLTIGVNTVSGSYSFEVSPADINGINRVEVYLTGGSLGSSEVLMTTLTTSPYGYALDTTALDNTNYAIIIKVFDNAGNEASNSYAIKVDNTIENNTDTNSGTQTDTNTQTSSTPPPDNTGQSSDKAKGSFFFSGMLLILAIPLIRRRTGKNT